MTARLIAFAIILTLAGAAILSANQHKPFEMLIDGKSR
jgi:hypothetical protein